MIKAVSIKITCAALSLVILASSFRMHSTLFEHIRYLSKKQENKIILQASKLNFFVPLNSSNLDKLNELIQKEFPAGISASIFILTDSTRPFHTSMKFKPTATVYYLAKSEIARTIQDSCTFYAFDRNLKLEGRFSCNQSFNLDGFIDSYSQRFRK